MKYDWVTKEMFDEKLEELVEENASTLLGIPGVYEVLSEHFNNDVLEALKAEREMALQNLDDSYDGG